MALVLFVITLVVLRGYSQSSSGEKSKNMLPACNCIYPNSNKYGVITNGKCKVTKCQLKQKKK